MRYVSCIKDCKVYIKESESGLETSYNYDVALQFASAGLQARGLTSTSAEVDISLLDPVCAKLALLYGVRVNIQGGVLRSFLPLESLRGRVIRFSDFCTELDRDCMSYMDCLTGKSCENCYEGATFVFDDKLLFVDEFLSYSRACKGSIFDVSEVTDIGKITVLYGIEVSNMCSSGVKIKRVINGI